MNIIKPIIGYHATDYKFESFDDAKTGYVGHYFSLNNTTDGDLPTLLRNKKYTITANLNVNNPAPFEVWKPVYDKSYGGNPRKVSHDTLRELGYDCIIRGEEIVVFDGSNIDIIEVIDNKTGALVESIGFRSFKGFIKSLKRDNNITLIESIVAGYNAIFENVDRLFTGKKILYHGTDKNSAININMNGIDMSKSNSGYFGTGFYTTNNKQLAIDKYADFSGDEPEDSYLVIIQLKDNARILDLDDAADWDAYKQLNPDRYISRPDFYKYMVTNGIDGLFDNSFEGIVIYNPNTIDIIDIVSSSEVV